MANSDNTQAPPQEGFWHSVASAVGIDPEAVKATAKAFRDHPEETAKAVADEFGTETANMAEHPVDTAKQVGGATAQQVGSVIGANPEAQAQAKTRMSQPGVLNKALGAEEYLESGTPVIGAGISKAQEQAGTGNYKGAAGTLVGTIAPAMAGGGEVEGAEAAIKPATEAVPHTQFDEVGGKEQQAPILQTAETSNGTLQNPSITSEGPDWERTHSAFVGGKKVGSVGYKVDPSGNAKIFGSVVDPELRGKGIGQKLYQQAISDAGDQGAKKITSDPTNTSPAAARVWEKLKAKGAPVEDITHPNGKPGYQIDLEKNPTGAAPAPQFQQALARRGELPNQTVNLSPAYGDTGKYVGGLNLMTAERQSALKEPYTIQITDQNGGTHSEEISAFSTKAAIKQAQKSFPNANDWSIKSFGERPPSTEYSVPTEKHLSLPTLSRPISEVMNHELGHGMIGQKEGLTVNGMLRHTHPDASSGMSAGVQWSGKDLFNAAGRIKPDKAESVVRVLMGGIAADEVFNDVPRAANFNFNFTIPGSDGQRALAILKQNGYSNSEAIDMMHNAIDDNKEYLQRPAISGIIKENAGVREPNLSRQYHMSAERMNNMHAEAQRRIANESNNETVGGQSTEGLAANEPEGKGGGAQGAGQPETPSVTAAKSPEVNPEYHPDLQKIAKDYGVSGSPKGASSGGASFIAPDGKFINLPAGVEHNQAISKISPERAAEQKAEGENRIGFLNDTNAVRVRYGKGRGGDEVHISVPAQGVTPSQIPAIRQAIAEVGRYGNVVMERADVSPENKGESTLTQEFPHLADTEKYLRKIQAHPDQRVEVPALSKKIKSAPVVSPNDEIADTAQKYNKSRDLPEINHIADELPSQESRNRFADQYDAAVHNPDSPKVKAAYDAMKSETLDQFNHLKDSGIKFQFQKKDPYQNADEMAADLRDNKRLKVFTGGNLPKDHPLADIEPSTEQSYNNLFRATHDVMGHAAGGHDFSEQGEYNAFKAHNQMYSEAAKPAVRTETLGQSNWVSNNRDIREGRAKQYENFAEQKAAILPEMDEKKWTPPAGTITAAESKKTAKTIEPWAQQAGKLSEENGAFTVDPRTSESPTSGHFLEAVPEVRKVSDKPNTPQEIQKFAQKPEVAKLLKKYPELKVGGYKNDAGKYELNLSAASNDPALAKAVATKLDQEATWDAGSQKLNPAGGKNVKTEFPDYPVDQRLRDLAPKDPGNTISSRFPSAVASTEDALRHNLTLGPDVINRNPALAEKWANSVSKINGFKAPEGADARTTNEAFVNHVADNLKWLYNQSTPEEAEANKGWYEGANKIAKTMSKQHGYSEPQIAGVIASLSPQKDWDMNVSLAQRLTDIVKNKSEEKATPAMIQKGKEIVQQSQVVNPKANSVLESLLGKIKGKSLSQLKDPIQKAAWVRLYDETNNPGQFQVIGPDGSTKGLRNNIDGTPSQIAWGSLNEINKAMNILKDGSRESISKTLGANAHKVRSFYNNIIDPNSPKGDVTVDTHAVAAGLMKPLSGKSPEVLQNFGGPSSSVEGLNGTYPLYHAAYTKAAKDLDLAHPRQLQSIVWDKIRNLFPSEFKSPENQQAIENIWKEYQDGKITADQARQQSVDYARSHAGVSEGKQPAAEQGELSGNSVSGESAGGTGRGAGSSSPASDQVDEDTSFNFGANEPKLAPFPARPPKKSKGKANAFDLINALSNLKKPASGKK